MLPLIQQTTGIFESAQKRILLQTPEIPSDEQIQKYERRVEELESAADLARDLFGDLCRVRGAYQKTLATAEELADEIVRTRGASGGVR